jgi:DNA-binding XRE family transcriptional regulator
MKKNSTNSLLDGRQLKAARIIVGLSTRQMAVAASVNRNSVLRIEKLKTLPYHSWAADKIAAALQDRGVQFTASSGKAGVCFLAAIMRKRSRTMI